MTKASKHNRSRDEIGLLKNIKIIGLGYCGMDYLSVVPHIPVDDKVEIIQSLTQGGGPAATALVTASRLGVDAAFCGAVGDDERGRRIIEDLNAEGVDTSRMKISRAAESPAGFSWIESGSGKRSIAWTHGDAEPLSADDIKPEWFEGVDLLHLDGHQGEAAVAAAELTRRCGGLVSLDAGTMLPKIDDLLELSDIVIASECFAANYTDQTDAAEAARKLFFGKRKFSGVTTGKSGSAGYDGNNLFECPHYDVESVVDTTGAGDVYHGAFAVAAARRLPWRECMWFATVAAALKCTALGGRAAIPDLQTVERLLRAAVSECGKVGRARVDGVNGINNEIEKRSNFA